MVNRSMPLFHRISFTSCEKDSIKAEYSSYRAQHPEIVTLVDGFMLAVLRDKPSDVFAFARRHFAPDRYARCAHSIVTFH